MLLYPVKRLWQAGHPLLPGVSYLQCAVLAVRCAHAVLGALTVALVYRLARRLWDRPTALAAAALLAVSLYHTLNSALATLDVPMSFLATLGLLLAARLTDSPEPRRFGAFGVVLGLLAATKISGAALAVAPMAMAAGALPGRRRRWIAGGALAAGIAAAVFAASTPHAVLHPREYLAAMTDQRAFYFERAAQTPVAVMTAWLRAMWIALTPPVAALALLGLALGRAQRPARRVEWGVLAFLAGQVLIWRGYLPARFLLPVVPVLCAYAARALVLMSRWSAARVPRLGAVVTALVVGASLAAVCGGIWARWRDPRTLAAHAIKRLVPPGSTVGFATTTGTEPWTEHRWRYPVLDTTRYRLGGTGDDPAFLVVTGWTLGPMQRALASGHLGPDAVWPDTLAAFWYRYRIPAPRDFRFYARLLDGTWGYALVGCWRPPTPFPPEFSDQSVGLYRRAALNAPGAPPARCPPGPYR